MHVLVTTQNRAKQDISRAFYACIYRLRMNVYIRAVFYTSFSLRMLLTYTVENRSVGAAERRDGNNTLALDLAITK